MALEALAMAWGNEDRLRGLAIVSTFLDDLITGEVAEQRATALRGRPSVKRSERASRPLNRSVDGLFRTTCGLQTGDA